jgi:hypothetical protein
MFFRKCVAAYCTKYVQYYIQTFTLLKSTGFDTIGLTLHVRCKLFSCFFVDDIFITAIIPRKGMFPYTIIKNIPKK